jgi:deoxyribonuclease-4
MVLLGAHISIAGGYQRAVEKGCCLGVSVVQIFTKNQLRWADKHLQQKDITLYRDARENNPEIQQVFAHGSYLYNFASPDKILANRSIRSIINELNICDKLGLPYLVIHPGSHMGAGELSGINEIIGNLNIVLDRYNGKVLICIETTAGQGNSLGYRFEHIRDIIHGVGDRRLGVCLDTCHIFSAGYDIREFSGYQSVIDQFDQTVGLTNLKVLHFNDSKGGLGTRIDRHMHIGQGEIGENCFKLFMSAKRFEGIPKVIETPKKEPWGEMDIVNLNLLKSYVQGSDTF